jgi:hypothetical protein
VTGTVRFCESYYRKRPTEARCCGIFAYEIRALGGLLYHNRNYPLVRLYLLHRLGLHNEIVRIGHGLEQAAEIVVTLFLT